MKRLFTLLLCLGGTLFLLFYIGADLIDQLTFVQCAPTTIVKGVITEVTSTPSSLGEVTCHAIIKFFINQNRSGEISDVQSSTNCSGNVGDVVDVAYHLADPSDARIIPPGGFLLGNWIMFLSIILVLYIGGTITFYSWNSTP